jgi:hypothetical protein
MPNVRVLARLPRRASVIPYREPRVSQFAALDGPPPGSFRAWCCGCRCERLGVNRWGAGTPNVISSRPFYAIAPDCPMHASSQRPAAA